MKTDGTREGGLENKTCAAGGEDTPCVRIRGRSTGIPMLSLQLQDGEWEDLGADHERNIARAIVYDGAGRFLFVHVDRDDLFGRAEYIETSGGGVEPGEDPDEAILRELREELGAEVEVLGRLGTVRDGYNLIRRKNVNSYYLCRTLTLGEAHMTEDEKKLYHLSPVSLTCEEAVEAYERGRETKIGRLVANRELPVLQLAKQALDTINKMEKENG